MAQKIFIDEATNLEIATALLLQLNAPKQLTIHQLIASLDEPKEDERCLIKITEEELREILQVLYQENLVTISGNTPNSVVGITTKGISITDFFAAFQD